MHNKPIKRICYTGVMAALIFIVTYAVHVPVGGSGGYIHLGDAMVYLAATLLPLPYAMAASAIGAGLSDLIMPGGIVWIPATVILKPLCCLAFARGNRILCKRNLAALPIGGLITIVGYFIATWIITGGIAVAVAELPLSFVQPVGSAICYIVLGAALDRMKIMRQGLV